MELRDVGEDLTARGGALKALEELLRHLAGQIGLPVEQRQLGIGRFGAGHWPIIDPRMDPAGVVPL